MMDDLFDGPRNLSSTERAIYMGVGLGIAAAGAKPRPNPLLNVAALAGGAFLAWSGYNGHCPAKARITGEGSTGNRRTAYRRGRSTDEQITELGY